MEWPRVKTALIIMLAVLNLFLAAVYFWRLSETHALEKTAVDNAVSVLNRNGISIDSALLKEQHPSGYIYEIRRDMSSEQALSGTLIGSGTGTDQGGGMFYYEGGGGWAKFWGNGDYEIDFINPPRIAPGDTEPLLALMGIDPQTTNALWREEAFGFSVLFGQYINGKKIINCETTAYYKDNLPFQIAGRHLSGEFINTGSANVRSAITVAISFIDKMKRENISCSEIINIELCYTAELCAPGVHRLTPVWEITTDTGIHYIT